MTARLSLAVLALGLALAQPVLASPKVEAEAPPAPSDVGYIFGRVETMDGDVYEGQLRWGTEESFWDDVFNADKVKNENLGYVDRKTLNRMRWQRANGWGFLFGNFGGFQHLFAIRFGDLKRIHRRHGDDLIVEFRNGEELKLRGGSNDVGAQITVVDPDAGVHELRWRRIRTIEFRETPAHLARKLGEPIYGTVKSGPFAFTGRIQWDNDECLSIDKLDGHTEDGKVSVAFGDIANIRKHRRGALVTLKSGQELYLTRTNDVNGGNRGVVVVVPRVGRLRIGWDDFDEVTFRRAPHSGRGYAEYAQAHDLVGTVETRDGRLSGRIVFDLDESWDFELLHGRNGDTEWLIPFRDIARITPRGRRRADVELRIGSTIELAESQDVTRRNQGLLVFSGDRKPKYVAWGDVTEVVFQ